MMMKKEVERFVISRRVSLSIVFSVEQFTNLIPKFDIVFNRKKRMMNE